LLTVNIGGKEFVVLPADLGDQIFSKIYKDDGKPEKWDLSKLSRAIMEKSIQEGFYTEERKEVLIPPDVFAYLRKRYEFPSTI
jgi:hypothetical protein